MALMQWDLYSETKCCIPCDIYSYCECYAYVLLSASIVAHARRNVLWGSR